jgi:hypothetical protein
MNRIIHTSFVFALLAGLLLAGVASPAWAQDKLGPRNVPGKGKAVETPEPAPPPALPGATATVAPADKTMLDLSPTDALFDAINRGDIASAKDALAHGADLNGHNILGMTPIDLSVDLSRNDITFLLLSLRGPALSGPPTRVAGTAPPGPPKRGVAASAGPRLAVRAPAPTGSREYAGPSDPGTPNPQAGFLGFGHGVQ